MSDATVSFDEAASERRASDAKHDRSTIEFPYLDLDTGIEVARAIYSRAGLGSCEIDELAAEMKQTVSGAFRQKAATARQFSLVEKEGRGSYRLSALGQNLVRAETEAEAKASAFLLVPLYKEIYDKYRGHMLPPTKALEREMAALGVAPKQTDKARWAFERSARQAGFFAQGEGRLVQPRFDRAPETKKIEDDQEGDGGGSGGGGKNPPPPEKPSRGLPPLIMALIESLPEDGESWSLDEASDWLQTAAYNFRYAYKMPGILKVTIDPLSKSKGTPETKSSGHEE